MIFEKNIVDEEQFDKLLKAKVTEFVELNVVPFKKKYLELLQLGWTSSLYKRRKIMKIFSIFYV